MNMSKVFPLSMPLNEEYALQSVKNNESHLWHLRYGHLNYKGLHLLRRKNMVIGLPNIISLEKVCERLIDEVSNAVKRADQFYIKINPKP